MSPVLVATSPAPDVLRCAAAIGLPFDQEARTLTTPSSYVDRSRSWRIGYGVALVLLMVTSAFMQYALGVLAPFLREAFTLSRTQIGLLTTALFVVASIGSPLTGRLIDAVGARRVLAIPFAVTCLAFLIMAVAPNYPVLLVSVLIGGTAMAFGNPLSNKLIALHVARGRQGPLMGVKQSGVQLGAFIAGIALPAGALAFGWRGVAGVTGAFIAASLVYNLWLIPPDPEEQPPASAPNDAAPSPALVGWLGSYALLMGAGLASVYAYLPLFAFEELGMQVTRAGALASLIGLIGVASRVVWGLVGERVRHPSTPLTALAGSAVGAQTLIMISPGVGTWLLWAAAVFLGASAVAWNAVAMLAVVKERGSFGAGRASGLVQLGFFCGIAIGPAVFGALADTAGYAAGWAAVTSCFAGSTVVAVTWTLVRRRAAQASS